MMLQRLGRERKCAVRQYKTKLANGCAELTEELEELEEAMDAAFVELASEEDV